MFGIIFRTLVMQYLKNNMNNLYKIIFFTIGTFYSISIFSQNISKYKDITIPIEERIENAISYMTLEEKVHLLHANLRYSSMGVPRLGIPGNNLTDGPLGIRQELMENSWQSAGLTTDSCTAFPALVCLAATWNPEMGYLYGKSLGEEARYRNKNVLLGPGVNIYRTPLNGRNFEYMSEDPFLTSQMAVSYIKGIQENHVASCIKHFAVNNQETDRMKINVIVDERTLHEIYLPAFKAAVKEGGVWAVMGAYNKCNGQHCCQNQYLLNELLREKWGFDGVVISDFGGVHDTKQAIFNGVDMEFGTKKSFEDYFLAKPYLELLKKKEVSEKELNDKVKRILRMMYRTNLSDNRPWGELASPEHANAVRRITEEGIVLLKNKRNILPLNIAKLKKVVIVGENAIKTMSGEGGSSEVKAKYEVTPLQGIENYLHYKTKLVYTMGYSSSNVYINDSLRLEAMREAREADVVIFVGGLNKKREQDCEGADRASFDLPYGQNQLISELAAVNSNIIVAMVSGNAYAMPWESKVSGILQVWYGGTESGNAIASVLFGGVNPSGKLPFTFPVCLKDNPAHALDAYPGNGEIVEYKEGIFVGYRWAEKNKLKPLFAFGHGLSYTKFKYGDIKLDRKIINRDGKIEVSIPVTNIGTRRGAEVVQLYIGDVKSSLPRPLKELKGFSKVYLEPGETHIVSFSIDKIGLSFYDPEKHDWTVEPGDFRISIGAASDDIRREATFRLEDK